MALVYYIPFLLTVSVMLWFCLYGKMKTDEKDTRD